MVKGFLIRIPGSIKIVIFTDFKEICNNVTFKNTKWHFPLYAKLIYYVLRIFDKPDKCGQCL